MWSTLTPDSGAIVVGVVGGLIILLMPDRTPSGVLLIANTGLLGRPTQPRFKRVVRGCNGRAGHELHHELDERGG